MASLLDLSHTSIHPWLTGQVEASVAGPRVCRKEQRERLASGDRWSVRVRGAARLRVEYASGRIISMPLPAASRVRHGQLCVVVIEPGTLRLGGDPCGGGGGDDITVEEEVAAGGGAAWATKVPSPAVDFGFDLGQAGSVAEPEGDADSLGENQRLDMDEWVWVFESPGRAGSKEPVPALPSEATAALRPLAAVARTLSLPSLSSAPGPLARCTGDGWPLLTPRCAPDLFSDDDGAADAAAELEVNPAAAEDSDRDMCWLRAQRALDQWSVGSITSTF